MEKNTLNVILTDGLYWESEKFVHKLELLILYPNI